MPRKDVTLTDKIVLLEKIKNQLPNTNHCQLVEVTQVSKSTTARVIQQQEKRRDEWTLCHEQQATSKKWKHEALNQWFSAVTG
jgi:hypothetical protein